MQDLRLAVRTLARAPGFSVVAVATLVLGIGATTAVFSVVNAVVLRPLPYREPQRLVHLVAAETADPRAGTSYRSYELWRSQSHAFEGMAVYYRNTGWSRVTVDVGTEPATVQAGFTSAGFFPLLGVAPVVGRTFTDEEEARREPVAVLSHGLWVGSFGATPNVIGRTLPIDGTSFTVIGVMPAQFQFPGRETRLWLPITTNRYWQERPAPDGVHTRNFFMRWNVVARLKPEATVGRAQAEMSALGARLEQDEPDLNRGRPLAVVPLGVEIAGNARRALFVLLGAVGLVWLIACGNVANLMLARGAGRERELAIRTALGAARFRLMRQQVAESLMLSLVGGGLGAAVAVFMTKLLVRFGPQDLPRLEQAGVDARVLAVALGASFLAATVCGLWPAWRAGRVDPAQALRVGGRSASGARHESRVRRLLVASQLAVSVVLLSGSGLLVRSLVKLQDVDPGFQPGRTLTLQVRLPDRTPDSRRRAFYDELRERIGVLPGVTAAGGIRGLFEMDPPRSLDLRAVEGRDLTPSGSLALVWTTVSGDYFRAMGVRLVQGRLFSSEDGPTSPLVAVIDQSMVRRYWPNEHPIGKRFKGQDARGRNDDWLTVIGVVADMRRSGLEREPIPHVFEWDRQSQAVTTDLVVRTAGEPRALARALRSAVRASDASAVIGPIQTLAQQLDAQNASRRFQTWLLGLFAGAALLLASVGLYGVISLSVERRRQEIGIRMALGAQTRSVMAMVLGEGLAIAALGLAAGLLGAWWLTRLLSSLLFSVAPRDPATLVAASALLLAVALLASLVPAWRATRVDPMLVVRQE